MISFKNFLNEQVVDIAALDQTISAFIAQRSITKPQYEDLKRKLDTQLEHEFNVTVAASVRRGRAEEITAHPDTKLRDLFWASVTSARDVLSLKAKLARVKTQDDPIYIAFAGFYSKYSPVAQRIIDLKEYVVSALAARAAATNAAAAVTTQKRGSATALITALSKFIDEYVAEAERRATTNWYSIMSAIDAAGGLDKLLSKPDYRVVGVDEYRAVNDKRIFYSQLSRKTVQRYAAESGAEARADYLAWVDKMTEKISRPVVSAEMSGNPWTGSIIRAITDDGVEHIFTTTMIINQSKYGKLFNQFPTRKK